MFSWVTRRKKGNAELMEPFRYDDDLTLDWDADCEAWAAALPDLGRDARIHICPRFGSGHPRAESCALIVQAMRRAPTLNEAAIGYLIDHCSEFVRSAHRHELSSASFTPVGMEIFEHEESPGEYSLTYDPAFDEGAIWRVRFGNHEPIGWSHDD